MPDLCQRIADLARLDDLGERKNNNLRAINGSRVPIPSLATLFSVIYRPSKTQVHSKSPGPSSLPSAVWLAFWSNLVGAERFVSRPCFASRIGMGGLARHSPHLDSDINDLPDEGIEEWEIIPPGYR